MRPSPTTFRRCGSGRRSHRLKVWNDRRDVGETPDSVVHGDGRILDYSLSVGDDAGTGASPLAAPEIHLHHRSKPGAPMASDPKRRQKQLARKKSKRKTKVAAIRGAGASTEAFVIAAAQRGPVERCRMAVDLFEMGIGSIFFSRRAGDGTLVTAVFLIDVYCLGVKDSFVMTASVSELEERLAEQPQQYAEVAPACARKLLLGAVAYARGLGIPPHKDYAKLERLFGDVDPGECDTVFEYGRDGRPLFIPGPHDGPGLIRRVNQALESA